MASLANPTKTLRSRPTRRRGRRRLLATVLPLAALAAACGGEGLVATSGPPGKTPSTVTTMASTMGGHGAGHTMDDGDRAAALLAAAAYQDVGSAEAAGYASTIDTLGCFQNPEKGGMGVHYVNADLLDAEVDVTKPEAMVYELDASGHVAGLVAHEYIVPVDAWTSSQAPHLFGMDFHRHATLPLWVLHTWLWKTNPTGMFEDWNPAVRLCPSGVPIFGKDLPAPAGS